MEELLESPNMKMNLFFSKFRASRKEYISAIWKEFERQVRKINKLRNIELCREIIAVEHTLTR